MARLTLIDHPTSTAHKIIKAETRGRIYALTTAEPFPTVEELQHIWQEERRDFSPYDETTGRYLR